MSQFLEFLARQRSGIAVLAGCLLLATFLLYWLAWIFSWGRFKVDAGPRDRSSRLGFVFADFIVKIIDDFRHLLALLILLIFGATLFAVMNWAPDFATVKEGLQAVMAAMGSVVASILGYYFGESAASKRQAGSGQPTVAATPPAGQPAVQNLSAPAPDIRPAPAPPGS